MKTAIKGEFVMKATEENRRLGLLLKSSFLIFILVQPFDGVSFSLPITSHDVLVTSFF